MNANGKDRADGKKRTQEVRAAVAEKRQRHAFRRQCLADDTDIEHGLEEDDERHADYKETSETVRRLPGDVDRQREESHEEKNNRHREHNTELFGPDGEHKVGMRLRKIQVLLHRLAKPRAPDVAVADRCQRLLNLIGCALCGRINDLRPHIDLDAEERCDSRHAVGVGHHLEHHHADTA